MKAKSVESVTLEQSVCLSSGCGSVGVSPHIVTKCPSPKKRKRRAQCEGGVTPDGGSDQWSHEKLNSTANKPDEELKQFPRKVTRGIHLTLALNQFMWGLTFGTVKPFLPIWLRYQGVSTLQIGLVQTVGVCGQMLAPVFGLVLDYLRHPALVTMVLCLGAAILGAVIWLSPQAFVKYGDTSASWGIYAFAFLSCAFLQAVIGTYDTMNLDWGDRARFGTYKMFCGLGWGISCALLGYYGVGARINIMFPAMVACCLIMALIAMILTFYKGRNPPIITCGPTISLISQLKVFFSSLDKKSCFVITNFLIAGAAFAGIQLYLFLWLQDLGGSNFLMGLTMVITIVGEVPCFYVYVSVLQKLGPKRILGVGSLAYIIRMLWYTLLGVGKLRSPWYVFVVEILHGLTFAWIFGSCSVYAYLISPLEIRNTTVQFLNAVYMGAGGVVGSLGGGVIYQYGGGRAVFMTLSIAMIPFAA